MDDGIIIQRAGRIGPHGGRACRLTGGDAGTLGRISNLTSQRRAHDERLEAEGSTLVAQEGEVSGVDHPRWGHPGGGAGAGRSGARIGEGRGGDAESVETDRGVERRGWDDEGLRTRGGGDDGGAERDGRQRSDARDGRARRNVRAEHRHADIPVGGALNARDDIAALRQDAREGISRGGNLQHAAVGTTEDVRHFEDGGAGVPAVDGHGAGAEADGDSADLFVRIEIESTEQPEVSAIERDARGIRPAALIARAGIETIVKVTVRIVEEEGRALAQTDDVGVGAGRRVDRRTQHAHVIQARTLTDFDDARTQRRGAGLGTTGGDIEIRGAVDDRTASVAVRIRDVDVAVGVSGGRATREEGDRGADFEEIGA